jgi:hypothetical protein
LWNERPNEVAQCEDSSESEDLDESDSSVDIVEDISDKRILRPRTTSVKPVKYSVLIKMDEKKGRDLTSEDCMFLYGPYPGYRIQ